MPVKKPIKVPMTVLAVAKALVLEKKLTRKNTMALDEEQIAE